MPRTVDEQHRVALLDRIVDYVQRHGVTDLSLRPLAKAVKSSPRVLLYYFASKDELVMEVIARARERQRDLFERLRDQQSETAVDACRAIWAVMSAPKAQPVFRLFFEIYAMALQDQRRYADFLRGAVGDWLAYIERPYLQMDYSREDARAIATLVIAGYRGFMLDLCATHDRVRIDRAVELWLRTLDALPLPGKFRAERPRRPAAS
jgi:AcrR family transcriptional regulator